MLDVQLNKSQKVGHIILVSIKGKKNHKYSRICQPDYQNDFSILFILFYQKCIFLVRISDADRIAISLDRKYRIITKEHCNGIKIYMCIIIILQSSRKKPEEDNSSQARGEPHRVKAPRLRWYENSQYTPCIYMHTRRNRYDDTSTLGTRQVFILFYSY